VVAVIKTGVSLAQTAWNVIVAVFTFFRDNVYQPIINTVGDLKSFVVQMFKDA
jgi:hypothetical protein